MTVWNDVLDVDATAEIPVVGRMNVGEHNSPLPRDRTYLIYKNYKNALNNSAHDFASAPLGQSSRSVGQYLFGIEKTFHDEWSSLELRMPFFDTGSSQFNSGFATHDPRIGNCALIGKRLLYCDCQTKLSMGTGLTMPTGDDSVISLGRQTFTLRNSSPHLVPFVGMLQESPDQQWFFISLAGVDLPTRGNQIDFVSPLSGAQKLGIYQDQALLYLDFTLGRSLHQNSESDLLTGVAVQGELHYAGTLDHADSLRGVMSGVGGNTGFNIGNPRSSFASTFASIVLQMEFRNCTDLQLAVLCPLNDAHNRFFDSEVIVSLVQRF